MTDAEFELVRDMAEYVLRLMARDIGHVASAQDLHDRFEETLRVFVEAHYA